MLNSYIYFLISIFMFSVSKIQKKSIGGAMYAKIIRRRFLIPPSEQSAKYPCG